MDLNRSDLSILQLFILILGQLLTLLLPLHFYLETHPESALIISFIFVIGASVRNEVPLK